VKGVVVPPRWLDRGQLHRLGLCREEGSWNRLAQEEGSETCPRVVDRPPTVQTVRVRLFGPGRSGRVLSLVAEGVRGMRSSGAPPPEGGTDPSCSSDDDQALDDREQLGAGQLRDEPASERDRAAEQRDEVAGERDRDAERADQRALELDARDRVADMHTLRVQELRGRGREVGKRALLDRERAGRDRGQSARDRELGARDREHSKQDRDHAATDELTGAYRRGVGLEELEREIARARRTGQSLVAAYVDVDGLKAVNDTHGHSAGDELLRHVAESLRHRMRTYDLLVRLGGDEFLCALPGVSVDEVQRRFHDLESALPAGSTLGSVSIGLSELRDGENAQELINRADRNLLAARSE
jgi:diguanylate cyclase (GGDEF)-like protein